MHEEHAEQLLRNDYGSQLKYGRIRGPDFCFYGCLMGAILVSSIVTAVFSFQTRPLFFWLSLGVLILVATFYSLVALGDPGIPQDFFSPLQREQMELRRRQNFKPQRADYCERCHIWRPRTTVHCPTCDVCIEGYDHHCPWVTKCVGRKTFIYFILFVLGVAGWLVFSISALARLALAGYL